MHKASARLLVIVLGAAALAGVIASCGNDETRLQVAAASDLRLLLDENRATIESAAGMPVTFVFGSSGQLQEQVLAGAPYGLFLSADIRYVDAIDEAGRLAPDGRAAYAVGALALIWRDGLGEMTGPADLSRPDVGRLTIANPGHAPYGRAAREALQTLGLWDELQPRLVLAEHVRQATDYVRTGNADAGLVALALVYREEIPFALVDGGLHEAIIQSGAVIAGSGQEEAARRVLRFLVSDEGQQLLSQYGFEPPP